MVSRQVQKHEKEAKVTPNSLNLILFGLNRHILAKLEDARIQDVQRHRET